MKEYFLKELIKINNGKDYRHLSNGNIPVYGSGGIICYVDKYINDGENILLPRKGSLNNIMYVKGKFWTVDTIYWADINTDLVDARYLYLYLTQLDLSNLDSGSTLPSMTNDAYNMVPIRLPDIDIQHKIADVIFSINDKISTNNTISSTLESLAKLIYDYWFVQFDFPDENGKPYKSSGGKMVWNEELKREIPKGWEVGNLLKYVNWESNSQPPKCEFIYGPRDGYIRFIQNRDYDSNSYKTYIPFKKNLSIVSELDILMDKYGDAGRVRYGIAGAFNVALGKIRPQAPFLQEYIRSFLESKSVYTYLHNSCMASTRASLSEANLATLNIVIPPDDVSSSYQEEIVTIRKFILRNNKENELLSALRDFLLPMLMNGQVTIKD